MEKIDLPLNTETIIVTSFKKKEPYYNWIKRSSAGLEVELLSETEGENHVSLKLRVKAIKERENAQLEVKSLQLVSNDVKEAGPLYRERRKSEYHFDTRHVVSRL